MQQRGQRTVPARPVGIDLRRRDHLDRLRGREIERARGRIAVVVGKIRTHDDQGLGPAPQRRQHAFDRLRACLADDQRNDGGARKQHLDERKLDLERMFVVERGVEQGDLRIGERETDAGRVDRDGAERRRQSGRRRYRNAGKIEPVGRPDQHHPGDLAAEVRDALKRRAGDRPGIDVTGVRCHNCLGGGRIDVGCGQRRSHDAVKRVGARWIECARNSRATDRHRDERVACAMIQ